MALNHESSESKSVNKLSKILIVGLFIVIALQFATVSILTVSMQSPAALLSVTKEDDGPIDLAVWASKEAVILISDSTKDTAKWIVKDLFPNVTWPIVVLLSIIILLRSKRFWDQFVRIINRFTKVSLWGSEISFSEQGAKNLHRSAQHAFDEFCRQADASINKSSRIIDLRERFKGIVRNLNVHLDGSNVHCLDIPSFRCTLFIQDILFEDNLYQLCDYYPTSGGTGAGRRFSIRYGIIGRSWRLRQHDAEGEAKTQTRDDLVKHWGMTRTEADARSRHRNSYVCVVLKDPSGNRLGVLYMDADDPNAFGRVDQALAFAKEIVTLCGGVEFTEKLQGVVDVLRKYRASINHYEKSE